MRRILIYLLLIGASLAAPMERTDVGKLIPIEAVFLYQDGMNYIIETDTGNAGIGESVDAAVRNLHDTAAGIIYMDTAQYLLFDDSVTAINELAEYLKPTVRVCRAEKGLDLAMVAEYLRIHEPKYVIKEVKMGQNIEKMEQIEERMKIS